MSKLFKTGIGYDQETMCCKCFNHNCHVHDALKSSIVSYTPLTNKVVMGLLNQSDTVKTVRTTKEPGDKNIPVAKGQQIGVL